MSSSKEKVSIWSLRDNLDRQTKFIKPGVADEMGTSFNTKKRAARGREKGEETIRRNIGGNRAYT